MAEGTVLARIALRGDRQFRRAVESAGDQMDDAGSDAAGLSFMLGRAAGVLENVRNDAVGASGALSLLQGRADEAGDELGDVGRSGILAASGLTSAAGSATTTSGSFTTLTASTNGLALSFGSLSTSLIGMAALIGGVGAVATGLVSALVPLVATLGGLTAGAGALAGAFGAVIGSGALAYGEQLTDQYEEELTAVQDQIEELEELKDARGELTDSQRERLRQLKQEEQRLDDVEGPMSALQVRLGELGSELSTIIADWGREFAPLIEDAINAIPTLVRSVLDAVGGMERFAETLRDFGEAAMDAIPAAASTMADLAREALPVLIDGMQWLQRNGGSIFDAMMRTTREVGPLLMDIADAVVEAMPSINELGKDILGVVLPAISDLIGLLGDFAAATQQPGGLRAFFEGALQSGVAYLEGPGRSMVRRGVAVVFDTVEAEAGERFRNLGPELGSAAGQSLNEMLHGFQRFMRSSQTQAAIQESVEGFGALLRESLIGLGHALANVDWVDLMVEGWKISLKTGFSVLEGFVEGLAGNENLFESIIGPIVEDFERGANLIVQRVNDAIRFANQWVPNFQMDTISAIDFGATQQQRQFRDPQAPEQTTTQRVIVETNDDRFDAYVDERSRTNSRRQAEAIGRGSYRGE